MSPVDARGWRDALLGARDDGFDVLDWLSARDDDGRVVVTACLIRSDDPSEFHMFSSPADVPSVSDIFPSAVWHERETAEMFGVTFEGLADRRPLLLPQGAPPPLRKDYPLASRTEPWPGAVDPAKPRRIQKPPGTPWQ